MRSAELPGRRCFLCGRALDPGALAFRMRVEQAADFDGYIDGDAIGDRDAWGAMTRAIDRSEEALAEEVYRERQLLVCPACAERVWNVLTFPLADDC